MANAAAQAPAQQAVPPGGYFDMPGIPGGATPWVEQDENTTNAVVQIQAGTSVDFQTVLPMAQTDAVADWLVNLNIAQTYAAGGGSLTPSAYAPLNQIGAVKLDIQNQYASINVPSGIDWYIFNLIRPYRRAQESAGLGNLSPTVGGTQLTNALSQANLINAAQWSTGVSSYNLLLRLPASQWFDTYYDLTVDGTPTAQGHPALVSPQYMAGTTRVILAKVRLNPATGTQLDNAPVAVAGGASYTPSNAAMRIRRKAIYAANPAVMPVAYPWQYRWHAESQGIGAVSQKNLVVPPDAGQVLSLFVRLWDPAAAAGAGAPIALSALSRVTLQFGSGLSRFDAQTVGGLSAGALLQAQWLEQHPGVMLPPGVFAFDLARDEFGRLSNKRALNVLTTAGVQVHMEFTGTQSASAYAVLGIESLVYVS